MMKNMWEKFEWLFPHDQKSLDEYLRNARFECVLTKYREFQPTGNINFSTLTDEQFLIIFELVLKRFYTQM
jgi:hypothetical protein